MRDLLSKDEVIAAFTLLGQRAARETITVEVFVVGGFAIIFGHKIAKARRTNARCRRCVYSAERGVIVEGPGHDWTDR